MKKDLEIIDGLLQQRHIKGNAHFPKFDENDGIPTLFCSVAALYTQKSARPEVSSPHSEGYPQSNHIVDTTVIDEVSATRLKVSQVASEHSTLDVSQAELANILENLGEEVGVEEEELEVLSQQSSTVFEDDNGTDEDILLDSESTVDLSRTSRLALDRKTAMDQGNGVQLNMEVNNHDNVVSDNTDNNNDFAHYILPDGPNYRDTSSKGVQEDIAHEKSKKLQSPTRPNPGDAIQLPLSSRSPFKIRGRVEDVS